MNQIGGNSLKAGVSTNHTWNLTGPWPGAEPPLPEDDQVWGISGSVGDFVYQRLVYELKVRGHGWSSKGSNAFWELDSVVPASLCLNEVLLKSQEAASSFLEQQASSALVRAGGGQQLPSICFGTLEEHRLWLMEARNFK